MKCIMDIRCIVPPLINLILFLLKSNPWNQDGASEAHHDYISKMPLLLLALAILLIFLFTSLKIPLTASTAATDPIRLKTRDFSGSVAISLLASFIFPPQLFWITFFLIICTSPWHAFIFNLFYNHFLSCLQAIPSLSINIYITQGHPHGSSEPEAAEPPQLETDAQIIEVNDIEEEATQDESSLDHEAASAAVNIDGQLEVCPVINLHF